MNNSFLLADFSALPKLYNLIDSRIHWMDLVGIQQWNVTDYWKRYPKTYYENAVRRGLLYIQKQENHGEIVGAVVLSETDRSWADDKPAYYIHNFVTALEEKGAGDAILDACYDLALQNRKSCLRLDCSADNQKLNAYYEQRGFQLVGICDEVIYVGNKREKTVIQ